MAVLSQHAVEVLKDTYEQNHAKSINQNLH